MVYERILTDVNFLKHKILELMFEVVGMDLGYSIKNPVQEAYFWPSEIGNFQAMTRGLKDVTFICIWLENIVVIFFR